MSFNLTTEKWIPVVTQDWQQREISLIELFETWQSYREIKADNPPTTLALYRFLLAIIHRAYMGPKNVDHWEEIKEDNGNQVIEYLQDQKDCFDLFHPEKPFMQDTSLTEDLANQSYALHIMQGDNTSTVFSHEHQWSGYSISIAEAVRLLIRLQTVELSSPRANYPAPNVGAKNTKATSMINVPNIILRGKNLQETLLLNLMRYDPNSEIPCVVNGADLPTWENGYDGIPNVGKKATSPQGYIHYLTYPWRRLRIFLNNNLINQVAITKGDEFPDSINEFMWECHAPFNKDKKALRLFINKQLWRDSYSFLQTSEKYNRPRIIDWIVELHNEDLIENTIHLQVFGMCADKAKPEAWSIENFSAPIEYITNKILGNTLNIAIDIAEKYQQIFRSFQGSPYYALDEALKHGDAGSLAKSLDGESRYWLVLDQKFTELLYALPQDKHTLADGTIRYGDNELPKWTQTVKNSAKNAFTDSIQSIRNYEARANALRTLNYQLKKLEGIDDEDSIKSKKSRKKS